MDSEDTLPCAHRRSQTAVAYGPGFEPVGPVADLAVGYALGAVRDVCQGTARNAFCCIRPPGHHVQDGPAPLGYCFYANVIIAERFAREQMGIARTLIVDWDFHQGNGTHGFLCGNEAALFFETFGPEMYTTLCTDFVPIDLSEPVPAGSRRINVRMPSASTNNDFQRLFEEKLVRAAEQFKPELVLISCGFDLKKFDSHGDFLVTANGISRLTRVVMQIADQFAGGKIVSLLEGGYADSPRDVSVAGSAETYSGLSQCAENHVKTLMTGELQPETPFYAEASTISLSQRTRHGIDFRGQVIHGLTAEDGPYSLTLTDLSGRTVRTIRGITTAEYDLGSLRLPHARYVVSVRGGRREVSRVVEL